MQKNNKNVYNEARVTFFKCNEIITDRLKEYQELKMLIMEELYIILVKKLEQRY